MRKSWRLFHDRLHSGFCPASFEVLYIVVLSCRYTLKLLDRVVSGARFLSVECDIAHHQSVAVLCMLYKSSAPDASSLWCSTCAVCAGAGYTRCCDRTSVHLCSLTLQNLAVPEDFYFRQYLYGTIWVTTYSMVWDWRISRAGSIPFYWPSYSLPFSLLLFSLSLLSLYGLMLWGWGLWTDRMLIALSKPCTANLF